MIWSGSTFIPAIITAFQLYNMKYKQSKNQQISVSYHIRQICLVFQEKHSKISPNHDHLVSVSMRYFHENNAYGYQSETTISDVSSWE